MEPIIRAAEEKDVDVIFSLIQALASHEQTEKYVLTDTDKLRRDGFGSDKKFRTLLAEKDGVAIGYLTYIWDYSTWAGDHYMYLENIFVLEGYRRLGVGEALMREAKAVCKNHDRLFMKWEVHPENEKAISFYKKQGATVSLRGIGSCKVESEE